MDISHCGQKGMALDILDVTSRIGQISDLRFCARISSPALDEISQPLDKIGQNQVASKALEV